jgi:fanconi anemia group M protein
VCRIVVDSWEQHSGIPHALADLGVEVVIEHLPAGDYDLGGGVLVERKTVVDLHLSLRHGRLWRQLEDLRRLARRPHLLIEGPSLDINSISPRAVRGVFLAVIGLGIPVLRSEHPADSALWLACLASRARGVRLRRDRPTYAQRPKPTQDQAAEAMLAAVPGISVTRARALLKEFGSVTGVVRADPEAWMRIRGIGPALAEALARAVS